jgi:hypothetical protein
MLFQFNSALVSVPNTLDRNHPPSPADSPAYTQPAPDITGIIQRCHSGYGHKASRGSIAGTHFAIYTSAWWFSSRKMLRRIATYASFSLMVDG